MAIYYILVNLLFQTNTYAVFEETNTSARSTGVCDATTAQSVGACGIFSNPASIIHENKVQIHLFHARPYGLKDLNLGTIALSWSQSEYAVAAGLKHLSNPAYQELQMYSGFALHLPAHIDAGLAIRYGRVTIQNYGSAGSLIMDIGAQLDILPNVRYGFCVSNVNYAYLGKCREKIPQILRTGVMVTAVKNTCIFIDIVRDPRFPLDIRTGAEYHIFDPLSLRIGSAVYPSRWSAGLTLAVSTWSFDYAYKSHSELGLTHLFSIQFDWKRENPHEN